MAPRRHRPSARRNDHVDPLHPLGPGREAALGGAPTAPPTNHFERGTVLEVDANRHVYRVAMNSGRTMVMSRLRTHPGDLTVLPHGTQVVVSFALGLPYIFGVLPPETAAPDVATENPVAVTDVPGHGGEDPVLDRNYGASARGAGEPRDVLPGDFVGLGPDGASVGALHGKVAQLRASPLAKLQAFGDNDLVQIVAGVYRLVTWMGEARVVNDDGKTSYVWRGGSDQLTQTGGDEERYTVRLDVGHTGDVIRLEVCNRDGQVVFRFHVNPQGRVELYAAGGFDQHAGAAAGTVHPLRYQGPLEVEVEGAATRRVAGDAVERHEANRTEEVSLDYALSVGQTRVARVGENDHLSVGGDQLVVVAGKRRLATRGDCETEVQAGGVHAVKTTGGESRVETTGGPHRVATAGGQITLDPALGALVVPSQLPDSVRLGAGALSHAVKWEELVLVLTAILAKLNALSAAVAAHTHQLVLAPPPVATPSPELGPFAAPLVLDLIGMKSAKVQVG